MNLLKFYALILISFVYLVSCSEKFDVTKHFDPTLPFEINQMDKSGPDFSKEIGVNDLKHEKLVAWLELNKHGWKKTDHNTHAGLIIVRQDDFRILLYRDNDMVVVGIDAKGNDMQQYKRDMDSNELMFLVDD